MLFGLPVWDVDLADLHVTRLDRGRGRVQAGVRHHVGAISGRDVDFLDELRVTNPTRTVWDMAYSLSMESAIVTIDAALHRGLTSQETLEDLCATNESWRGSRRAWLAIRRSDPASESPGESRLRYAMSEGRIPRPKTQFKFFGPNGAVRAIADFAWPEWRHIVEFDGLAKYGVGDDLAREKAREDWIRAQGWGVTRVVWSQLSEGMRPLLIHDIATAMHDSRRRFAA